MVLSTKYAAGKVWKGIRIEFKSKRREFMNRTLRNQRDAAGGKKSHEPHVRPFGTNMGHPAGRPSLQVRVAKLIAGI
jgi:hypothetical protein